MMEQIKEVDNNAAAHAAGIGHVLVKQEELGGVDDQDGLSDAKEGEREYFNIWTTVPPKIQAMETAPVTQ